MLWFGLGGGVEVEGFWVMEGCDDEAEVELGGEKGTTMI